jgi:hypothetical protein
MKNLFEHVCKCEPANTQALQQIIAFVKGLTYSAPHFCYLLAVWCAHQLRPFNIVTDNELTDIFHMLDARADVPHPMTVSRDVKDIFHVCKTNVIELLWVLS